MERFPGSARDFLSFCRPTRSRSEQWRAMVSSVHTPSAATSSHPVSIPKLSPSEQLMLRIRQRDWEGVRHRILSYPWDAFYRMKTGNRATPLHLLLMHKAPRDVVTLVVDADPSALLVQDTEGWTPLHVNILYGGDLETTLFLIRRGGQGAAALHSKFVGAPLHLACRHGSSLEILSELVYVNPEQIAIRNDAGSTPASLLWKSYRHQQPEDISNVRSLADKLYFMLEATLDRSQQWYEPAGVHDAIVFQKSYAQEADCVSLFLKLYPDSPKRLKNGKLPLHIAAAYSFSRKNHALHYWFPESMPNDPLRLLMERYPAAAKVADSSGRLPIFIALSDGRRTWTTGVDRLVQACPDCLSQRDPKTALFPFQLAAVAAAVNTATAVTTPASSSSSTGDTTAFASEPSSTEKDETDAVETIFRLLLACPEVLHSNKNM